MVTTIIIRYKIPGEIKEFIKWKEKLDVHTIKADGFLDKTEIPLLSIDQYYSIILRFDSKVNGQKWLKSEKRKELLIEAEFITKERLEAFHEDNNFWFHIAEKKIIRFKQVLVSFIAVYPLTQLVPRLVQFILNKNNINSSVIAGILTALIISALMVYVAIPLVMRFLRKWIN